MMRYRRRLHETVPLLLQKQDSDEAKPRTVLLLGIVIKKLFFTSKERNILFIFIAI